MRQPSTGAFRRGPLESPFAVMGSVFASLVLGLVVAAIVLALVVLDQSRFTGELWKLGFVAAIYGVYVVPGALLLAAIAWVLFGLAFRFRSWVLHGVGYGSTFTAASLLATSMISANVAWVVVASVAISSTVGGWLIGRFVLGRGLESRPIRTAEADDQMI